jgi:hypothetical protein
MKTLPWFNQWKVEGQNTLHKDNILNVAPILMVYH